MNILTVSKAIQALLETVNEHLDIPVPVVLEGESAGNPSPGYVTWDWAEPLTEEQLSEDVSKIWYPKFIVTCWATSLERRNVLEEAVLDVLTPKQSSSRRMPFSGRSLDIWFHCIHHIDSDLVKGQKDGQTGPEVPGISLNCSSVVEYEPVVP